MSHDHHHEHSMCGCCHSIGRRDFMISVSASALAAHSALRAFGAQDSPAAPAAEKKADQPAAQTPSAEKKAAQDKGEPPAVVEPKADDEAKPATKDVPVGP